MITHDAILAALAELRTTAEAATPGPWRVDNRDYAETIYSADDTAVVAGGRWGGEASVFDTTADAIHIAAWSPAHSLRWLSWAEQVAAEHGPGTLCEADCTEIHRLASALGLEET